MKEYVSVSTPIRLIYANLQLSNIVYPYAHRHANSIVLVFPLALKCVLNILTLMQKKYLKGKKLGKYNEK